MRSIVYIKAMFPEWVDRLNECAVCGLRSECCVGQPRLARLACTDTFTPCAGGVLGIVAGVGIAPLFCVGDCAFAALHPRVWSRPFAQMVPTTRVYGRHHLIKRVRRDAGRHWSARSTGDDHHNGMWTRILPYARSTGQPIWANMDI